MDASSTRRTEENELLISLVHRTPAIWDQRTNEYKNIDTRQASWVQVAKAMGLDGTERTYTRHDPAKNAILSVHVTITITTVNSVKYTHKPSRSITI